jgi:DNA-binding response OmpR family regulator
MSERKILLVDDDALMRRSLAFNLQQSGYQVITAGDAESALEIAQRETFDLILMDIGLPGMDGLDALQQLRKIGDIPVIFLTARRRELDEALGLELGADDYVTKPFDLDVLRSHIKAVLRRSSRRIEPGVETRCVTAGDLEIDPSAHTARIAGKELDLSPREFDLLHAFALQPGKVLATPDLLAQVWGAEFIGQPQVVYVHIRWLREKIEDDPNHPRRIQTVRGVGYKYQIQER